MNTVVDGNKTNSAASVNKVTDVIRTSLTAGGNTHEEAHETRPAS